MFGGGGTGLEAGNVAVLGAWLLVGLVVAVRSFRWNLRPHAAEGIVNARSTQLV